MATNESRLIDRLLQIFRENGRLEFSDIRRRAAGFDKKNINHTLYTLRNRGLVVKHQECPPIWGPPCPLPTFNPTPTVKQPEPMVGVEGAAASQDYGQAPYDMSAVAKMEFDESGSDSVSIASSVFQTEQSTSQAVALVTSWGNPDSLSLSEVPAAQTDADPGLEERILQVLRDSPRQRALVVNLAKRLGFKTKKPINPTLYKLASEGKVAKCQDSPPMWQLMEGSSSTAGQAHVRSLLGMNGSDTSTLLSHTPNVNHPPNVSHPPNVTAVNGLDVHPTSMASLGPPVAKAAHPPEGNLLAALNSDSFAMLNKNPISAFLEFAQSRQYDARFVVVRQSGPPHDPRFFIAAVLGQRSFPPIESKSKKDGRRDAADRALRILIAEGQYEVAATPLPTAQVEGLGLKLTEFDRIAGLSHICFNGLAGAVPEAMSGRKVLATVVMKRAQDHEGIVVSLGTGNRCIGGDCLNMEGNTVNDSHAEVIARRGFMRFVYQNLLHHEPGSENSLFQTVADNHKLQVKADCSFHLYISMAPCGDSALMTQRPTRLHIAVDDESREHHPIFSSEKQGLLRTKIERGEGAVPVKPDFAGQTWDGILRGERLLTMSCSDKLCRWNVLGLQGALLSLLMEPVYMASVTLGYLYEHGHLARAICCRLEHGEPNIHIALPKGYDVNHPLLGRVTAYEPPRETEKTKNMSINWVIGDHQAELTDGTLGKTIGGSGSDNLDISQLSKCRLFAQFHEVCQKWDLRHLLGKTYYHTKQASQDYQKAKAALFNKFEANNWGTWVKKPMEQELFT